jgi:hypothetical protein
MTEKPAVSYPPLSDEDLARYGGPPELAYLPLVNMANELIAARARLRSVVGDGVANAIEREQALGERLKESTANEARLRAEVERLTADLVEVDAKRRRAEHERAEHRDQVLVALGYQATNSVSWDSIVAAVARKNWELTDERKVHAETHKLLAESNADHNALLLHLHTIREAAGIKAGLAWGDVVSTVSERLRDKDQLLCQLEAICHRLEDNDVPATATTWIGQIEAGIMRLIEQRDGACARREAEETARIKAAANAVFEAQRTDLAIAIGVHGSAGESWDWNALVRRCGELRRDHVETTAELIEIDRALMAASPYGGRNRAERIRVAGETAVKMRGEVQDATKKLCKALGIADTATLAFAVTTAVQRIGEVGTLGNMLDAIVGPRPGAPSPRPGHASVAISIWSSAASRPMVDQPDFGALVDLGTESLGEFQVKSARMVAQLLTRYDQPDCLKHAEMLAKSNAGPRVYQMIVGTGEIDMAPTNAAVDPLDQARDRIKALEEHNREMHKSVAMALGHERGGAGVGWKDLIAKIERVVMERGGTAEAVRRATDRLAKIATACGVDTSVETPWIENISERIVAAIERQGADLREARKRYDAEIMGLGWRESMEGIAAMLGLELSATAQETHVIVETALDRLRDDLREAKGNAESLSAAVVERDGKLAAYRLRLTDAASTARGLSDQLDDIEQSL